MGLDLSKLISSLEPVPQPQVECAPKEVKRIKKKKTNAEYSVLRPVFIETSRKDVRQKYFIDHELCDACSFEGQLCARLFRQYRDAPANHSLSLGYRQEPVELAKNQDMWTWGYYERCREMRSDRSSDDFADDGGD